MTKIIQFKQPEPKKKKPRKHSPSNLNLPFVVSSSECCHFISPCDTVVTERVKRARSGLLRA